jgi:hypothetical protein
VESIEGTLHFRNHGSVRRIAVRPDGVAMAANEAGWVDFIK